jgi:hypothetical protein
LSPTEDLATRGHGSAVAAEQPVDELALERAAASAVPLEHGLGGVAVVDLRQQPAPRTHHRFEHDRVAHLLDRFQGGLAGEGDHRLRHRHAGGRQRAGGQDLVAADLGDAPAVDGWNPGGIQQREAVHRAAVMNRAVQHHINPWNLGANLQLQAVFVQSLEWNAAPPEGLEKRLLFHTDAAAEDADHVSRLTGG